MSGLEEKVLDHGFVRLLNLAGPVRRADRLFDADDIDPALTARLSFGGSVEDARPREVELKLVDYLLTHKHTTPIEMIEVWLEMKLPVFVARQFVRHRTVSINEVSARYTKLEPEFYVPKARDVGVKSKSNKQGRDRVGVGLGWGQRAFVEALEVNNNECYDEYTQALEDGIPNELARCLLPLNVYTRWVWKQNLHNLMHFVRLRLDSHAQWEAQEYARAVVRLVGGHLPWLFKEFVGAVEDEQGEPK